MADFFPEGILINEIENIKALKSLQGIEKAMKDKTILEARAILCDNDNNLIFELGEMRGIMPRDEVSVCEEDKDIRDIAVITRVGKPCTFIIERIDTSGIVPKAYLSRKAAQKRCLEEYLDHLEDGDIINARVTHFEPFGAFCDIGCGIISLLSIDCISVSRISHPRDRFYLGEYILCAVKCRDEIKLGSRGRIALTHKELLGTWMQNAENFHIGETVVGIIRSIETYGIFIELAPNLAGLAEYRSDVSIGQCCSVFIKNIIPAKMKVKLVIIDAFGGDRSQIKTEYYIKSGNIKGFRFAPEKESDED